MDNLSARDLRSTRRERDALERERLRLRQEFSQQRDRYLQQQRDRRIDRDMNPVRVGPTQISPSYDHQQADEPSPIDVIAEEMNDDVEGDRHEDDKDKGEQMERHQSRIYDDSFLTLDRTHGSLAGHEGEPIEARGSSAKTEYETVTRPKYSEKDQRSLDMQELELYRRMNALRIQSSSAKKELEAGYRQRGLEQTVHRFPLHSEEFSEGYSYTPGHDYERAKTSKASSTKDSRRQKGEVGMGERDHYNRIDRQTYEDMMLQQDWERTIPSRSEYRLEADRIGTPSRRQENSVRTDPELKSMGKQREEMDKESFLYSLQGGSLHGGDSMLITEQITEEERNLQDQLDKLAFQEKILEEENKAREREEAEINERLKVIKLKHSHLEEQNRKSQRLSDMKEKQEKLEISLKRKIEEQIRHDERIRVLRQEERRLAEEVTKRETSLVTETQESEKRLRIDLDLKPPVEAEREELSNALATSNAQTEQVGLDATMSVRLEELNRKEAYLKQLEAELTKKEDDIRVKLDLKPTEVQGNESQEVTGEKEASAKAAVTHLVKPYKNTFSGTEPIPKNESSFEEWKLETEYLAKSGKYSDETVNLSIRHSLKGQARKVLVTLGPLATSEQIVNKLENVFGNVASGESVLQEFYTACQKSDESVTLWGIRIEEILKKAIDKGHVSPEQKNTMLKTKFWRALYSTELKNATRVHFESIESFELLRRKVRAEENKMATNKSATNKDSPPIANPIKRESTKDKNATTSTSTAQHQPVLQDPNTKLLRDLAKRMEAMEKTLESFSKSRTYYRRWQDRKPTTNQNQNKPQDPKVPSQNVPSKKDENTKPKNQ